MLLEVFTYIRNTYLIHFGPIKMPTGTTNWDVETYKNKLEKAIPIIRVLVILLTSRMHFFRARERLSNGGFQVE